MEVFLSKSTFLQRQSYQIHQNVLAFMLFILTYWFWKSVESFKSCDGFFKDLQNRRSLFVFNNKEFEIPPRKQVIFDSSFSSIFWRSSLWEQDGWQIYIFETPSHLVHPVRSTSSGLSRDPLSALSRAIPLLYCLYHKLIESDVARRLIRVAITVTRGWNSD